MNEHLVLVTTGREEPPREQTHKNKLYSAQQVNKLHLPAVTRVSSAEHAAQLAEFQLNPPRLLKN